MHSFLARQSLLKPANEWKAKIGVLKSPTWNLVLDSWILFGSCDLGSWFLIGDEVDDSVAQLVEQYTFNVWVLGSSPSGITRNVKRVSEMRPFFALVDIS